MKTRHLKLESREIKLLFKSVGSVVISTINRLFKREHQQERNGKIKTRLMVLFSRMFKLKSQQNRNDENKIITSSGKAIFLRKFKIRTRLIASFVILLVAVILTIGIYSYNSSIKTIDDKVKRYSLQVMDQTSVILDNKVDRIEAYINDIGLDRNVQNAILNYNSGSAYDQYEQTKIIQEYLDTKFVGSDDIDYCALLYGNDFSQIKVFNGGKAELNPEKISKSDMKNLQWSYVDFVLSGKAVEYYGVAQNIKGVTSGGVIAKMVLIPKPNYLSSGFKNLDIGKYSEVDEAFPVIVINGDGTILASRNENSYPVDSSNDNSKLIIKKAIKDKVIEIKELTDSEKTKPLTTLQKAKLANLEKSLKSDNLDIKVGGVDSLVTYSQIGDKDLYVLSVIPYKYLNSAANELRTKIIFIGFICVIVALLLCLIIARSVSRPLGRLVSIMKKAKSGDLTDQVTDYGNDEISDVCNNFNDMLGNISTLISKVRDSSQRVSTSANMITTASESTYSASGQVAQTIGEIAKGATEQATEISDSVIVMTKLSDGITIVEDNVIQVISIANKINGLNANAYSTINKLNDKSIQVSDTTNKVYTNINDLSNSMNEIQKILKMQNTISEQTNLLALNASIEAARAGDAGRGFAVVASEVSKLAEKSKEFNGVINSIISSTVHKTNDTLKEVLKSQEVVNEQVIAVKDTEELFSIVFSAMGDVASNIEKTEESVEDIIRAKEKVLDLIQGISAVAEQAAATTEEIFASTQEEIAAAEDLAYQAKELKELSEYLNNIIAKFKV